MANSIGQDITSRFYKGPINGGDWAAGQPGLGDEYFVADSNAGRVRQKSATARTVEILAGTIGGFGVKDKINATVTLPALAEPASGSRWYTIAAERDWTLATPETKLVALTGAATQAIASSRVTNPGTGKDHQPLALVKITKGESDLQGLIDLRAVGYGGGFYLINDPMVMDYMSKPGYRFRTAAGDEWVILLDGSRLRTATGDEAWSSTFFELPNYFGLTLSRARKGGRGDLKITGTRLTGQITGVDSTFYTLGDGWKPAERVGGVAWVGGTPYKAYIEGNGEVHVNPFTVQAGQQFRVDFTGYPIG
ncbi:hypothetical protein [Isoptericola sp. NPDC056134]|uniref:hypothetical protein n=1 Tax=Isoptericola sp. NPDC056134 TaxID=3345723 RepID=UPI0035EC8505